MNSSLLSNSDVQTIEDIRRANLVTLVARSGSQRNLAERLDIAASQISNWINQAPDSKTGKPRTMNSASARRIEEALGLDEGWMDKPHRAEEGPYLGKDANLSRYIIRENCDGDEAGEIPFLDARGSCGGGLLNVDAEHRLPLIKEASWFKRYRVRPADALAVWADGDSMAEFIVDGDIVIFNRRKTEPRSGAIFLLEHPDGLRIKRLRREIDGTWVLESTNPDKRTYPDERVSPEHAGLLKILGEFVYRQGG